MKTKPVFILGTGLSHDGSACILKDGRIAVAIEKERITRKKHDGGNDRQAVQYCLDALGIDIEDISLIVQAANFEKDIRPDYYSGQRISHPGIPVTTISHHLAHAWSAAGTSPFRKTNVLVIDGAGSPADQCDDWPDDATKNRWINLPGFFCEKDSFYHYADGNMQCLYKDFSEVRHFDNVPGSTRMPVTRDSIGGVYAAASNYCFGNMDDAGKLMGLAPYGSDIYKDHPLFRLQDGKAQALHHSFSIMSNPAHGYEMFRENFQHYADIAKWVQKETEKAVVYTVRSRMEAFPADALCYAGGVALNAVSNALLLKKKLVKQLYMQPAAGDNGLALGCAFYGWQHILGNEIIRERSHSVFFGKSYGNIEITTVLNNHPESELFKWERSDDYIRKTAAYLAAGKTVAWFQGGAEFGPRALGHRSILANPAIKDIQQYINTNIKFREDFRPFAPAVLKEEVALYFKNGWESPYMILVDEIKDDWRNTMPGIVHVDGTCRVQTVDDDINPEFAALLRNFKKESGIPVLVNTSLNRRGMPIAETPRETVDFFLTCALDVLVIHDYILIKTEL